VRIETRSGRLNRNEAAYRRIFVRVCLCSLLVSSLGYPTAVLSDINLSRTVFGSGGGRVTASGTLAMGATMGQGLVGRADGGAPDVEVRVAWGFWYNLLSGVTSGSPSTPPVPIAFALGQNYPNPLRQTTTIQFALPEAQHVRIDLFDMSGRHVRGVLDQPLSAGHHQASLSSDRLASGAYFYQIRTGDHLETRRLMVIK